MSRPGGLFGLSTPANARVQGSSSTRDLSDEEKRQIEEAFDNFDHNQDGYLEFYELKFAMKALGFDVSKQETVKILRDFSSGRDRKISRVNFISLMTAKIAARDPREELKRAFELFDPENTGKIGFQQLKQVAQEIGETISDEELRAMIDVFDLDGDDAISLEEFISICEGL